MSGGLECEIRVDEARLKKVPEFITIWGALDESDKYVVECRRKVARGEKLQVPLGPWLMLGVYMRHCSCLLCCMAVGQ